VFGFEVIDASAAGATTVIGSTGADTVIGSTGGDSIDLKGGTDSIFANNGNDTVTFYTGATTIDGGEGTDRLVLSLAAGSLFEVASARISSFEILDGSAGNAITISGGAAAESIMGSASGDSIVGGDGADTIRGFAGADTILAGLADSIDGGAGDDLVILTIGTNAASIEGGLDNDTLRLLGTGQFAYASASVSGFEAIDASFATGSVTITAGSSATSVFGSTSADSLIGGAGNDTIIAKDGNDTIVVGAYDSVLGEAGDDWFNYVSDATMINGGAGNDRLVISGSFSLQTVTNVSSIEILDASTVSSSTPISITGASDAQTIYGGSGNDTIDGYGGIGDYINAGLGNDRVTFHPGAVTLIAGGGDDRLVFASSVTSFDYSTANAFGFDIIDASAITSAVTIIGSSSAETILGGSGGDTIVGGGGTDSIVAGAGNDSCITRPIQATSPRSWVEATIKTG